VPSICDSYVKIDNDCTHDYNMTFYCELAAKGWMKTITQIQTHRQVGLLFAVGRLYGKTLQQVVGWTFIRTRDANTCINEAERFTVIATI